MLSAPDKKIVGQGELAALGVQRLQIDGHLLRFRLILTENSCRAFEKVALPRRDLVRMNVELLRQLSQRLIASHQEGSIRAEQI